MEQHNNLKHQIANHLLKIKSHLAKQHQILKTNDNIQKATDIISNPKSTLQEKEEAVAALALKELDEILNVLKPLAKQIATELDPIISQAYNKVADKIDSSLDTHISKISSPLGSIADSLSKIIRPIDTLMEALGIITTFGIVSKAGIVFKEALGQFKIADVVIKRGLGDTLKFGAQLYPLLRMIGAITLGIPAAAYGGWQVGRFFNHRYESLSGQPLGSDVYDWTHPKESKDFWMSQAVGSTGGGSKVGFGGNDEMNKQILGILMNQGMKGIDAADILANFKAESGLNPFKTGDNGQALGLGQWHPDRQRDYANLFGHTMESVQDPNLARDEQSRFAVWELQHTQKEYWQRAQSDMTSGSRYSRYIERPAAADQAATERGVLRDALKDKYNTTHINVTVPAGTTDPYEFGQKVGQGILETRHRLQYTG